MGRDENKKNHLINWIIVSKPKKKNDGREGGGGGLVAI